MYADYSSLRPLEIGNSFGELNLGAFDLQRITNVLKTEKKKKESSWEITVQLAEIGKQIVQTN